MLYQKELEPPVTTISEISTEIVHNLKGQFEDMQGNLDAHEKQRRIFFSTWDSSPFYNREEPHFDGLSNLQYFVSYRITLF
jgi:hypothetical protein